VHLVALDTSAPGSPPLRVCTVLTASLAENIFRPQGQLPTGNQGSGPGQQRSAPPVAEKPVHTTPGSAAGPPGGAGAGKMVNTPTGHPPHSEPPGPQGRWASDSGVGSSHLQRQQPRHGYQQRHQPPEQAAGGWLPESAGAKPSGGPPPPPQQQHAAAVHTMKMTADPESNKYGNHRATKSLCRGLEASVGARAAAGGEGGILKLSFGCNPWI
jgi:hypothetical protein